MLASIVCLLTNRDFLAWSFGLVLTLCGLYFISISVFRDTVQAAESTVHVVTDAAVQAVASVFGSDEPALALTGNTLTTSVNIEMLQVYVQLQLPEGVNITEFVHAMLAAPLTLAIASE